METRTEGEPARAGHDLLLTMAGRLPDRLLWRLRDWSAAGAGIALRTTVPRALVRHRVGITEDERALLRTAVLGWGGSSRAVDAVLHADAAPESGASFLPAEHGPGWDATDLVLRALAPVVGAGELRRAWRVERAARRAQASPPARVVLLSSTGDDPDLPTLTGAVQRALRAQGEPDPRVEVLGPDSPATAYHREALVAADLLWRAAGATPARGTAGILHFPDPAVEKARASELVGHG